jgi:hypothetical protein
VIASASTFYTYIGNDPTNKADPKGMDPGDCIMQWCPGPMGMWWSHDEEYGIQHPTIAPEQREEIELAITIATIPTGGEGVEIEVGARVFWSGGKEAMIAAADFAKSSGASTLEMSLRGKLVQYLSNTFGFKNTEWLWKLVSKSWANGARERADVFLGEKVNPNGIWKSIEEPRLERNGVEISRHSVPAKGGSGGGGDGSGTPDFSHGRGCPIGNGVSCDASTK